MSDDARIEFHISLNLEAAIAGISADHDRTEASPLAPVYNSLRSLQAAELRQRFEGFRSALIESIDISIDGQRRVLTLESIEIPPTGDESRPRISNLRFTVDAGGRPASFEWRLRQDLGDSVIRLRAAESDEVLYAAYIPAGAISEPISLEGAIQVNWTDVAGNYLRIGFVHIVPKGLDHILFVVGLFLLSSRLSALFWQISAFTLAHTFSLALAALDAVSIPAQIVEPVIALSIAWIAVENLITDRMRPWRPAIVFVFGLVHGLGFAGVLDEIGVSIGYFFTSLIAFNLGVELGQLTVVALCFIAFGWAMRWRGYRSAIVMPASLSIAFVALYWAIERSLIQ